MQLGPRFRKAPAAQSLPMVTRPSPLEIGGNKKIRALLSPLQPGPWRGSPVAVIRCGTQEAGNRPLGKLAHGSAAAENALAEPSRGGALDTGRGNRVCGPCGLRMVPGVVSPRQKGGKACPPKTPPIAPRSAMH